ncbi:MAG TPA: hypothetical protein VK539_11825 [Myxococcaceae bacterium]|jgi:hypothetical protein|nr:hypothetical protein [Myxococcaceae bacterium]
MSNPDAAMNFGTVRTEPEKNKWVFNMRVKIEPYFARTPERGPKKAQKPDRFSVKIETPRYEP